MLDAGEILRALQDVVDSRDDDALGFAAFETLGGWRLRQFHGSIPYGA